MKEKINALKEKENIKWLSKPEAHDYPAALSYLKLIYDNETAAGIVKNLRSAPLAHFKAKDIFRASELSLLGVSNSHVDVDKKKIKKGVPLSPLLLVRDQTNCKLIIADGYHRMCAVYIFDEDAIIPCRIV